MKLQAFPVDTGRKLNIYMTFRRRPGRLLNVLCTFNLRPVSTGFRPGTLLKRDSNTGVFLVNNAILLRTAFFMEHLPWLLLR